MGVKLGRSHWGRNRDWGCLRIGCWRQYLGLRGTREEGSGQNYIMRCLMTCTAHPVSFSDQIDKDEGGRACSTYGGEQRCIRDFGGETWGKETTWKIRVFIGGYKMDLQEVGCGGTDRIELDQDRDIGGHLWMRQWTVGFHKMRGIWLHENPLLCSMELST